METFVVVPLEKAWSDSAREASAAARRGEGGSQRGSRPVSIKDWNKIPKIGDFSKPVTGAELAHANVPPQATGHKKEDTPEHVADGHEHKETPAAPSTESTEKWDRKSSVTGHQQMDQVKVKSSSPDSTEVEGTVEMVSRIKPPPEYQGSLTARNATVICYGHAGQLMKEKYGNKRGEAQYEKMIDSPRTGIQFVVGQKIQREKLAMMDALGKRGNPDQHHYQGLYKEYQAKLRAKTEKKSIFVTLRKDLGVQSPAFAAVRRESLEGGAKVVQAQVIARINRVKAKLKKGYGYPAIRDEDDLEEMLDEFDGSDDMREYIIERAQALGLEDELPSSWSKYASVETTMSKEAKFVAGDFEIVPLEKAWSDSAREASIRARGGGRGDHVGQGTLNYGTGPERIQPMKYKEGSTANKDYQRAMDEHGDPDHPAVQEAARRVRAETPANGNPDTDESLVRDRPSRKESGELAGNAHAQVMEHLLNTNIDFADEGDHDSALASAMDYLDRDEKVKHLTSRQKSQMAKDWVDSHWDADRDD